MGQPVIVFESIDMFAGLVLQFFQPSTLFMGQPSIGPVDSLDAMNPALFLFEKPGFSPGQLAGHHPVPDSMFLIFRPFLKNTRRSLSCNQQPAGHRRYGNHGCFFHVNILLCLFLIR